MSVRVVSRGELRETLRAHADDPDAYNGLRYYELPVVLAATEWERLDEEHRGWYMRRVDEGRVIDYELSPGSYDAWVIET